jgi:hypothetical protein
VRASVHFFLFGLGLAAWCAFFIAGWPSYFQQYSALTMAVVCVAQIPPVAAFGYWLIRRRAVVERLRFAGWLAFYTSVPYVVIDYAYLGLLHGLGLGFLSIYWYLTVSYFVPWLVFVPLGYQLGRPQHAHQLAA